jgi:hypothetical protein
MGFMGYGTAKLKEKAEKRNMTVDEYCNYLEYKKRTRHWSKKIAPKQLNEARSTDA